jgi:LysR family hydrogen peroxide-inducible transcriptional activator
MLNITQLEYLKSLVQFGSFSIAAKKLQITQPALSLQIAKLEKELGFRLLDRRKRPLELTSEGEVFYQKAVDILLKIQELNKVTADMGEQISGNLKIGIIPTLAPYLVPMFINDLNKNYPQLQVEINELKTEEIIHELKNGQPRLWHSFHSVKCYRNRFQTAFLRTVLCLHLTQSPALQHK